MIAEQEWLTIYMHWRVHRFERWATPHIASIKSFVSVLYFGNSKNAVEHNGIRGALANSLPYRGSLLCLERKCIAKVDIVNVHAQGESVSQIITEMINILCWEANPPNTKMFRNSNCVSMRFQYLPREHSFSMLSSPDGLSRTLTQQFLTGEIGSITALLEMKRLKPQKSPWAGNPGLWRI